MEPYAQLVGKCDIYIAPAGESEPDVDDAPAGNWVLLGETDGDQSVAHSGGLTYFRDNDHTAPVKAARGEEDVNIAFTLVKMTQENYARIIHDVSKVATHAGPPATKTMPLKRGTSLTEYALLLRGAVDSPYGNYPGQYYVPRCVSDAEPTVSKGKTTRSQLECKFVALEDDDQSDGEELGHWTVQTA